MPSRLENFSYNRDLIRKFTGHLSQLGGIQYMTLADGASRGVRLLEFRTGSGLIFKVAVDRGMDIGWCEYQGLSMAWISPSGLPAPWFFDQTESFGWLRTAMGGLINTCGLMHIGDPEEADVSNFHFPGRQKTIYGVHDRAALIPARLISYGERWEGEVCFLEAAGEISQAQAFGENLHLYRQYRTHLGATSFILTDEVENMGQLPVTHKLLYHINLGYPLIDEGTRFVAPFSPGFTSKVLAGQKAYDDVLNRYTVPHPLAELQVFQHFLTSGMDQKVPIAVINPNLEIGFYVIYDSSTLPVFLETRLMREGMYMVCLEPATNTFGRENIEKTDAKVWLEPGEKQTYSLEFGILTGQNSIREFQKGMSHIIQD